jgi:hypothetical protein
MRGWRFWVVPTKLPGAHATLVSPFKLPPLNPWPKRRFVAHCDCRAQCNCGAGAYACANLVELLFYARCTMWWVKDPVAMGRQWWLDLLGGDALVVVGRVTLNRPTEVLVPVPTMPSHPPIHELKGRAAQIDALYVCPTENQEHEAHVLQPDLAARYGGIPVHVGEPAYTTHDWEQRSRLRFYAYEGIGLGAPT